MGGLANSSGIVPSNFQADFNTLSQRAIDYLNTLGLGITYAQVKTNLAAEGVEITIAATGALSSGELRSTGDVNAVDDFIGNELRLAAAGAGIFWGATSFLDSDGTNLSLNTAPGGQIQAYENSTESWRVTNGGRLLPFHFGCLEQTPAQITANQNDYNVNAAGPIVRISSDAARNITGLVKNVLSVQNSGGDIFIFKNVGSFTITFTNQDAASTAANRFLFSTGANIAVAANGHLRVFYDSTTQRWRDF